MNPRYRKVNVILDFRVLVEKAYLGSEGIVFLLSLLQAPVLTIVALFDSERVWENGSPLNSDAVAPL